MRTKQKQNYKNMRINRVTITGADDKVDPNTLAMMSVKYPFVEWGILFSKSKTGQQRYPSNEWITTLCEVMPKKASMSAHFCGWYSRQVLEEKALSLIASLHNSFGRVQLNYNFSSSNKWRLSPVVQYTMEDSRCVILQNNKNNEPALQRLYPAISDNALPRNLHFLFDESGGVGKPLSSIGLRMGDYYVGYAGGIGPDNVSETCRHIVSWNKAYTTPIDSVWIDMESGVRTDNEFDIDKVEKVLSDAAPFITD